MSGVCCCWGQCVALCNVLVDGFCGVAAWFVGAGVTRSVTAHQSGVLSYKTASNIQQQQAS